MVVTSQSCQVFRKCSSLALHSGKLGYCEICAQNKSF